MPTKVPLHINNSATVDSKYKQKSSFTSIQTFWNKGSNPRCNKNSWGQCTYYVSTRSLKRSTTLGRRFPFGLLHQAVSRHSNHPKASQTRQLVNPTYLCHYGWQWILQTAFTNIEANSVSAPKSTADSDQTVEATIDGHYLNTQLDQVLYTSRMRRLNDRRMKPFWMTPSYNRHTTCPPHNWYFHLTRRATTTGYKDKQRSSKHQHWAHTVQLHGEIVLVT